MKTFPVRCASFVLIGVLALAAAPRTMALIEITPDPVAIHAHGDFKGYIAEEGFVPGQDFKVERRVVPGVRHLFESRSKGPMTYNSVEVDLGRDDLIMEAEKGRDDLYGRETLDRMARRLADPMARPIVLINADFWGDRSVPVGLFVDEGTIWRGPWGVGAPGKPRAVFAFDEHENLFIGIPDWTAELTNADGSESLPLRSINLVPGEDFEAMAFTWPVGENAPAPREGYQAAVLTLPGGEWLPNDPAPARVQSIGEEGEIPLDERRIVIHLKGDAPAWMEPGRDVVLSAKLAQLPGKVHGVTGGGPLLVQDGEVMKSDFMESEGFNTAHVTARHPRSAIGLKEDGKTLVLGVVDGRQAGLSIGINLPDLGEWMKEQGCVVAMNLDGGGSSTLAVRDEIVNFPSDAGGPRAVSNALVIRRTAPVGEPQFLAIKPSKSLVPPGGRVGLEARLFDEALEPIDPLTAVGVQVDWTQEEPLPGGGVVTEEGIVLLGRELPGTTLNVQARLMKRVLGESEDGRRRYQQQELSRTWSRVEVSAVDRLVARPDSLLMSVDESLPFEVTAYAPDGRIFPTSIGMFDVQAPPYITWSESTGLLTAHAPGSGVIEITYGTRVIRVPVAVDEHSEKTLYTFDALPPGDVSQWMSLTRANADASGLVLNTTDFREGYGSWDWSYGMAPGGVSKIALPLNLPIQGNPLGFGVWIRGDGNGQWLRASITDATGRNITLDFNEEQTGIDFRGEWRFLKASIHRAAPTGNPPRAPYRFNEIYIVQPNESRKQDGKIGIDGLTGLYLPEP